MRILSSLCFGIYSSLLATSIAWASPDTTPDPNASVVYLRTSCDVANSGAGESPVENCFEDMAALNSWIYTRPVPSAKLLVEVGPGEFGGFSCNIEDSTTGGDLTFRGAGVGKTQIGGVSHGVCNGTKWVFENLTIKAIYAVLWFGRGETTWTNVVFEGLNTAWYDAVGNSGNACALGRQGTHRFFSSRFVTSSSQGNFVFLNACGDNWFWGSEFVFTPAPGSSGSAILSKGSGNRMHLYGSNVRAEAHANAGATGNLTAITVQDGAELHSHGVGIDVVGKPGWTLTFLDASAGGEIHANASSYFMQPSSGATVRRIVNNGGHVHAPYLWETHPTPPAIQSVTGADIAVVTSATSDNHPHMVIYDSGCTSNWYDMVDKACRP